MAGFSLSKWYLDCISNSGDLSIVYAGKIRWGSIRLSYSSVLDAMGGAITTRHSFRAIQEPRIAGGSLLWESKPLHVDGEWSSGTGDLRCKVFSSSEGQVEWRCLIPQARARIGRVEGWGYAEHLTMNLAPWKLPLRTLRWGRFTTGREWVVWIGWCGEASRTLVYRDGLPVQCPLLADAQIDFDDGSQLLMDQSPACLA